MKTAVNSTEIEALYKEWRYDFAHWRGDPWFDPVRMVVQADTSESYEMDRTTLFQNRNGSYVLVYESGCSCYEPSSAERNLFPNLKGVKAYLSTFEKQEWSNDSRVALREKLERKE